MKEGLYARWGWSKVLHSRQWSNGKWDWTIGPNRKRIWILLWKCPFRITAGIPTILRVLYSRCVKAGTLLHISSATLKSRCVDLSILLSERLCINKTVKNSRWYKVRANTFLQNVTHSYAKYHKLACPQYLFISSGLKCIYWFAHFFRIRWCKILVILVVEE